MVIVGTDNRNVETHKQNTIDERLTNVEDTTPIKKGGITVDDVLKLIRKYNIPIGADDEDTLYKVVKSLINYKNTHYDGNRINQQLGPPKATMPTNIGSDQYFNIRELTTPLRYATSTDTTRQKTHDIYKTVVMTLKSWVKRSIDYAAKVIHDASKIPRGARSSYEKQNPNKKDENE